MCSDICSRIYRSSPLNFFLPSPWLVRTWRAGRRLHYKSPKSPRKTELAPKQGDSLCVWGAVGSSRDMRRPAWAWNWYLGTLAILSPLHPSLCEQAHLTLWALITPPAQWPTKGLSALTFSEWVETKYSLVFPKVLNQKMEERVEWEDRKFSPISHIFVYCGICICTKQEKNFIARKERSLAPAQCFWGSFGGHHDLGDSFIPRDENSKTP